MNTTTLAPPGPPVPAPVGQRREVLDDAHVGHIRGALGTVPQHATTRCAATW
jgi:hypothetical protein